MKKENVSPVIHLGTSPPNVVLIRLKRKRQKQHIEHTRSEDQQKGCVRLLAFVVSK